MMNQLNFSNQCTVRISWIWLTFSFFSSCAAVRAVTCLSALLFAASVLSRFSCAAFFLSKYSLHAHRPLCLLLSSNPFRLIWLSNLFGLALGGLRAPIDSLWIN